MKITRAEQRTIRAHWPNLKLRFREDGTVEAQQRKYGAYGALYTPRETINHLRAIGMRLPEQA